jgi:pimeloyl-ACP methyl ester carboxylesterase
MCAQLPTHSGFERLAVCGISGGGPHAMACAALLPDQENIEDIQLVLKDRRAARAKCEQERVESLAATSETIHKTFETLLSPVDRQALTPELAEYLDEATQLGLAPGADGSWDDDVAYIEPWGFELEQIRIPVLLLHGRQDRFVPFAHGEWLARHIPGGEPRLLDGDGNLTLIERHLEGVHAWLLERLE